MVIMSSHSKAIPPFLFLFLNFVTATSAMAQLSTAGEAAFALGSGQTAGDMKTLIASFLVVFGVFLLVWSLYGAYSAWARDGIASRELFWICMRSSVVLTVLIWIVQ